MMDAAVAGKLKAMYVVGANPVKTFGVAQPDRLSGLELLGCTRYVFDRDCTARGRGAAGGFVV